MGIPKDTSFQVLIQPQLSSSAQLQINSQAVLLTSVNDFNYENYYSGEIELGDAARYQVVTRDRQQKERTGNDNTFFDKDGTLDAYDFFLSKTIYTGFLVAQTWEDDYSFFWYYPPFEEAIVGDFEEVSEALDFFGSKEATSAEDFFTQEEAAASLTLQSSTLANGKVGTSYNVALSTTGGESPYSYTLISGSLPPGLSIVSGNIQGVPIMEGTFEAIIRSADSSDPTLQIQGTIRINVLPADAIVVDTSSLADANLNEAYSQLISASGGSPDDYVFSATGLPTGLTINSETGLIAGTPTVFGSYTVIITVNDGLSIQGQRTLALNVIQPSSSTPVVLASAALPSVNENVAYSQSRAITGGSGTYPTLTKTSGDYPTGISASIVGTNVVIAGTPTVPGAYSFSLRVTDDEGVQSAVVNYSIVVIDVADPEIPFNPTLLGVGWEGSNGLVTYPKTGRITGGASSIVVEIDDGAGGKTPAQRFLDALALVPSYSRVLIRNDSDALVSLTSAITRSTVWGDVKEIFAYDNQRIRLKNPGGNSILRFSGGKEHWKGFDVSGITGADSAPLVFQNRFGMDYLLEDFHMHDCASYGFLVWAAGGNNINDGITLQDFVVYDWNDPVILTGTNAGEAGIATTSSGGSPSQFVQIVRMYAHIKNGDDILDFFGARNCLILDSVLRGSNPNTVGGDGNGAKMGGTRSLLSGYNTIRGSLVVSVGSDGITDNGIALPITVDQNTVWDTGGRAMDVNNADGSTVTNNVKASSDTILTGGATTLGGNNWQTGHAYAPLDAANGDFSYSGSLAGSGLGGQNPGASVVALKLAKAYWNVY